MNNKKEITASEEHRKYIKNNIFLFLLFFLPVSAVAIFIGIFSIEKFKTRVNLFFVLIILAVVFYILQSKIDKYAKSRQLTGGKLYYEWMHQSWILPWIICLIFIVIIIIIAVIRYGFRVIF
ncbi:MAG: hypothetical protein Q7R99_02600 [bacterium]|nr:hypothetical protein [bacterium]